MDPKAEYHAQQAPEVVNTVYPEAVDQQHNQFDNHPQYPPAPPPKAEGSHVSYLSGSTGPYFAPGQHYANAAGPTTPSDAGGEKKRTGRGTICGCTVLVFVLCAIIALLTAAVIGLAAGTGVEASRANTAQDRADRLNASLASATSASPTSASTSFAALDDNCSGDPDAVTGTTYNAFSCEPCQTFSSRSRWPRNITDHVFAVIGDYSFTIQCWKDAVGDPLMKLFTSDMNTCMDACASYSQYTPASFGNNTNTTCGAVSFIPLWTNKTAALVGGAPGNCYLKPKQTGSLDTPNIGTDCHAAVLASS